MKKGDLLRVIDRLAVALEEVSLGRILQHVQRSGERSWAILTSWRARDENGNKRSRQDNVRDWEHLRHTLDSMRFGYFKFSGTWTDPDTGKPDSEPSLFVIGIDREHAERLMRRYRQQAIVYSGPDTEGRVWLLRSDGGTEDLGTFHPGRIAASYLKVRGRPFVFESWVVQPDSWMEAIARQAAERDERKGQ